MENTIETLTNYNSNFESLSKSLTDYVTSRENWIFAFFDYITMVDRYYDGDEFTLEYVEEFMQHTVSFCVKCCRGDVEEYETVYITVDGLLHIDERINQFRLLYSDFEIDEKIRKKKEEIQQLQHNLSGKRNELNDLLTKRNGRKQ